MSTTGEYASIPRFYLTIGSEGYIEISLMGDHKGRSRRMVKDRDELVEYCIEHGVREGTNVSFMCSSTLDHPEESTDKPEVIALAEEIRS